MSSQNDNAAAHVEKPTQVSTEASTMRESASARGVNEAYEEMGRNSSRNDSTRVDDSTRNSALEGNRQPGDSGGLANNNAQTERPDKGLTNIEVNSDGSTTSTYNPEMRNDRLSSQRTRTEGNVTTTDRGFEGRADGMQSERTVKGPDGTNITQNFSDNTRVETSVNANGERTTVAYDQNGKVLPEGRGARGNETDATGTVNNDAAATNHDSGSTTNDATNVQGDGPVRGIDTRSLAATDTAGGERNESPEQRQSRERLDATADQHITDPAQREQFRENMRKFEERAQKEGLKPEEVAKTFDAVNKLMTAPQTDSKLPSAEQRATLAQNFMHHAADPSNIDQGDFNVCNTTVMQEKLMSQNPSLAADILQSAATTGQFTAPDGKQIQLDAASMQPVQGSDKAVPSDKDRSYATQVLNHALANDITQRRATPEFAKQLHGVDESGRRLQRGDTGERISSGSFDGPNKLTANGTPDQTTGISASDIDASMQRLTGEEISVLMNDSFIGRHGGERGYFGSPQDLHNQVREAEKQGRLPLALVVNGNDPALVGRPGSATGDFNPHVVSIRGIDAETGQIKISNQWGSQNDRNIDAKRLFEATQPPPQPPRFVPGTVFGGESASASSSVSIRQQVRGRRH
jgi:hypothetical protein